MPRVIIRNSGANVHLKNGESIYAPIETKDCIKIVKTNQTFEMQTKSTGFIIVPKMQVLEKDTDYKSTPKVC